MLNNFASTQQGGTGTVTTTTILDGTIANADVASDAAIDVSKISLDDAVVFNESGADKDFRVESDGKTHMLFVDGGNNRVGIGTDSPSQTFEVFNNTADAYITKFSGADGNMSYVGGARLEFSRDGGCYIAAAGGASASMIFQAGDGFHTRMKLANDGRVIIGDGGAEDTAVVFDGNAQDYYVGLDDSADDLVIGLGSAVGTTPAISINSDRDVTISDGAIDFDIASHDTSNGLKLGGTLVTSTAAELNLLDGKSSVGDASGPGSATDNAIARFDGTGGKTLQNSSTTIDDNGDIVVGGTTPTITIGDGGTEDTALVFDGNAKDFYVALDDSADKLLIGEGSTVGTNPILTITDDTVTIGDGATVDTYLNFDGNAADFRIGIDDGTDKLEIGAGTAHGTTAAITIDSSADMTLGGGIACADEEISRPKFKDYAETINALGDLGGGTDAIDFTAGNVVSATVSTSTQTFTFTNPPANGIAGSFTLFLTNGGSQTVNWPSSVDWAGGTAPSLTSSGVDVLTFTTLDAGTIWYGFAAGTDMK